MSIGDADKTQATHVLEAKNVVKESIELESDFLWTCRTEFEETLKMTPESAGLATVYNTCAN